MVIASKGARGVSILLYIYLYINIYHLEKMKEEKKEVVPKRKEI